MPYTNCSACGAKALVGATRCPRCQAPFVSYDIGSDRVETVNCPNCGVQRPVAIGVCPNCLMSTAPSGRRLARGLVLASVAVVALLAVGYAISRRAEQTQPASKRGALPADTVVNADSQPSRDSGLLVAGEPVGRAASAATGPSARVAASPALQQTPATAAKPALPSLAPPNPAPVSPAPPKPAPPPRVAVPDTGRWEYAVATTWVRLRSAPTRESDMLRMIDSAQRVRLGPPLAGWRSARVGVDRGWVDPRFFTVVPAPRP
jgi:hypothetical protein